MRSKQKAFTLIELLVVLVIIALLLTIVSPNYFKNIDKANETVLKENLFQLRETLDKFYADQHRYPESLDELVSKRYLRSVPMDPITQKANSWQLIQVPAEQGGGIQDVKSGASGQAKDGSPYANW